MILTDASGCQSCWFDYIYIEPLICVRLCSEHQVLLRFSILSLDVFPFAMTYRDDDFLDANEEEESSILGTEIS